MLDSTDLVVAIKKAAIEAVGAMKPTEFVFGKVISISPLKINIEQKLTLSSSQIVLSRNVTDFKTKISLDNPSTKQPIKAYNMTIKGTISAPCLLSGETTITKRDEGIVANITFLEKTKHDITVYNALKVGEEVILLRMQGGQKYLVIDRVVKP